MSKEFSKEDKFQPILPIEGDLEAAVTQSVSAPAQGAARNTDSMGSVTGQAPARIVQDNSNQMWTDSGTNASYMRDNPTGKDFDTHSYMNAMSLQVGADGNKKDLSALNAKAGASDTATPEMQQKRYLAKPNGAYMPNPTQTPAFNALVAENIRGTKITSLQGTLSEPNTASRLVPGLFIENKPVADDIHQGGVGDCFFLAALLQIVNNDPQKILNMMKLAGDTVSTTFYHRKQDGQWEPVEFQSKLGIIGRLETSGPCAGIYLPQGAQIRIAENPARAWWSSSIEGQTLKINKRAFYEAAFWVNCMEQAYTIYAQRYGKAGRGAYETSNASVERYQSVNGGCSEWCMSFFYGSAAQTQAPTQQFGIEPGVDDSSKLYTQSFTNQNQPELLASDALAQANSQIITQLMEVAKTQGKNTGQGTYMSAGISTAQAAHNLMTTARILFRKVGDAFRQNQSPNLRTARTLLAEIANNAENISNVQTLLPEGTGFEAERMAIDDAMLALEKNEEFQALNLPEYTVFREMIGTTVTISANDHYQDANGQRRQPNLFLYNAHAYNVKNIKFISKDGSPIATPSASDIPNLDINKTVVTLQNPHGTGTPAMHEAPKEGNATGTFNISLRAFLNNTGMISAVKVS